MIRILILDDDETKTKKILESIGLIPQISPNDVVAVRDLIQARDACTRELYDVLILDLRLPNRIGDTPQDTAGRDFIKELISSTTLLKPYHIIGITAYKSVLELSDSFFEEELWGIVKYDPRSNNWRSRLLGKLQYLVTSRSALLKAEATRHIYDLGIVTALPVPEHRSILDLPADWEMIRQPNDPTIYYRGRFMAGERQLSVVSACALQMGMPAAAVLASKMIVEFRPRHLAVSGIAAAVSGGEAKLGDILIADQCWDYGSGKHKVINNIHDFEPDPRCIPLRSNLKEYFRRLQADNSFLSEIEDGWRGARQSGRLKVHIGPMASGSAVVQDGTIVDRIKEHSRKLIGLDMEAYGVFYAAENSSLPQPAVMSIKSVCDFADQNKSDECQTYAAYTSARYLFRFALAHLCPDS